MKVIPAALFNFFISAGYSDCWERDMLMTFFFILFGLVFLLLLAFLAKELLGVHNAEAPFAAACAVIVWLLVFALMRALIIGAIALYILTLLGVGFLLFRKHRLGALRDFARSYPVAFFLLQGHWSQLCSRWF